MRKSKKSEAITDAEQARRDREYVAYLKRANRRIARPLVVEPDPWGQVIIKPSDIFKYLDPEPPIVRRKRRSVTSTK